MANLNTPFGFRQYKGTGSPPTYEQVVGQIPYNAAAIFFGDVVRRDASTGLLAVAAAGSAVPIAGVFAGCKYLSVSQKKTVWSNYWPGVDVASGNLVEGYYINDPNAQFLVQSGNGGPVTQASVGKNIDFGGVGAGNTANGISAEYVDFATIDVTATLPFRIVQLDTNAPPGSNGSDQTSAYNLVIVAFNNVETKSATGN